jgi:hypothetical protein
VVGGSAQAYEWSVWQNGVSKILGVNVALTTKPDDLFVGAQELRFRVRDAQGNWAAYATHSMDVVSWPRLYLPVHGSWRRSGNNYNEGDHLGDRAGGAQDWNHPSGGDSDFGLETVAALSGTVSATGAYSDGGRYVNIEHDDSVAGYKFRFEYMHLSTVLVRQGQSVVRGQPIGLFGNTGSASTTTHLHYVVSQWINGRWVSVIPEPCFADDNTVLQTVGYDAVVSSTNRVLPGTMLVLPESAVSATNMDEFGYGRQKYWDVTTTDTRPTSSCTWDFVLPADGTWNLWMHNPSGLTKNILGATSHNTTRRAVFDISRPRVLGMTTHTVDQASGEKGGLLLVTQFDALAGDRVQVYQHNATGESGLEMTYDDLVLTLETPSGSGGGSTAPVPPGSSSPPSTGSTAGNQVYSSGGGCAMVPVAAHRISSVLSYLFLLLILVAFRSQRSR